MIVAFQGEHGAYSEQAVRQYFGADVQVLPCTSFRAMFAAALSGEATHLMLPVENSLAGTVIPAYDELVDHDLRVQGEVILRVRHCLMAAAGVALADITHVQSHPQALAQCVTTLRRMGIEAVTHYDTAGGARDLSQKPQLGMAALASELSAETYSLNILARDLQDMPFNYTRFFVLSTQSMARKDPSKTSIIFTTRHEPGALYNILGEFARRGINLMKIESRPRRTQPWHYRFYVDFGGHEDERHVQEALMGVLKYSSSLKVLGSYPAAPIPVATKTG